MNPFDSSILKLDWFLRETAYIPGMGREIQTLKKGFAKQAKETDRMKKEVGRMIIWARKYNYVQ